MDRLVIYTVTRFAPRIGWPLALLVIATASTPSLAASGARLPLPEGLIFWAGVGGALLGLAAARLRARLHYALWLPAALAIAVGLVAAGGRALPPADLLWSDLAALAGAAGAGWRGEAVVPTLLTPRFLTESLPRLAGEIAAAADNGEAGAALLVTTAAVVLTWAGALCLGLAAGARRPTFAWGLPLLVALAATTILSGGRGLALVLGIALLLLLAAATAHMARERGWDHTGAAYSEELRWGVLGWAALAGTLVLAAAYILPTSIPTPLARLLWPPVELPSGLAAIDRNVQRGAPPATPVAQVALSQLPAVPLGVSLEQAPSDTVALRVVTPPLPPGPWPHYWRARVLTRYNGRSWSASARVGPFYAPPADSPPPPGAIVQQIEDARPDRGLLIALPDVLGLDVPAAAERLADGSLAALTGSPPGGRFRAVSLPQELAGPIGDPQAPPPDLSASLAVPGAVSERVRELARTLAAGAATPLDRALALEGYLRGLPYAYTVRPVPEGGEAVDQFLFAMREGYCTYYASAMAIMARSLGIPARVAVGYATGTYDADAGAYIVREGDAHAWPELLIDGRWLPFEPTPVRPLPARGADQPPQPAPTPAPIPAPPPPIPWPVVALAAAGLAGALGAGAALILRRRRGSPLDRAQRRVELLGARAGVPWPAGATLHEYAELVEHRAGESPALRSLVAQIELIRYGGRPLDTEQLRRLRGALEGFEAWLRRGRRAGRG